LAVFEVSIKVKYLKMKTVSVHKLIILNDSQQSLPIQVHVFNIILFTVGFDLIGSESHIFPPFITTIIKASPFNYWSAQEMKGANLTKPHIIHQLLMLTARDLMSKLPYFPVDNARVIYTKKYIERKNPVVRVIHKVCVMQLKSKKF
jgi:hypothetical protein